jgi:hypothetical protein
MAISSQELTHLIAQDHPPEWIVYQLSPKIENSFGLLRLNECTCSLRSRIQMHKNKSPPISAFIIGIRESNSKSIFPLKKKKIGEANLSIPINSTHTTPHPSPNLP